MTNFEMTLERVVPGGSRRATMIGLTIFCAIVFWRLGSCDFINYDDPVYVTHNSFVQEGLTWRSVKWAFSNAQGSYQPLTWLSLMADTQLAGVNASFSHRVNWTIHLFNVLLIFGLFETFGIARWKGALCAAVFACHPLNVESVAWITERKGLLASLWLLLSIDQYVKFARLKGERHFYFALLAYLASLLSKPSALGLPCLLLLLDYWPLRRLSSGAVTRAPSSKDARSAFAVGIRRPSRVFGLLVLEKLPFFVLSILFGIIALRCEQIAGALSNIASIGISSRFANVVVSYIHYLLVFFWPHNLAILYARPQWWEFGEVGSCLLVLCIVVYGVLSFCFINRALFVGWMWYSVLVFPISGVFAIGPHYVADRYAYIPMIGLLLLIASVPVRSLNPKLAPLVRGLFAGIVLTSLAHITTTSVKNWANSGALWKHTLLVTGRNPVAHNNYGVWLAAQGSYREAQEQYILALAESPSYATAKTNLINNYYRNGDSKHAARLKASLL